MNLFEFLYSRSWNKFLLFLFFYYWRLFVFFLKIFESDGIFPEKKISNYCFSNKKIDKVKKFWQFIMVYCGGVTVILPNPGDFTAKNRPGSSQTCEKSRITTVTQCKWVQRSSIKPQFYVSGTGNGAVMFIEWSLMQHIVLVTIIS